jgi:hypothetical protein
MLNGAERRTEGYAIRVERVEGAIFEIRGQKVMLDADLASLYGVETGALVRAVKRNLDRFPADFQFQLSREEVESLRCQIGISKGRGGRRYLPYVFTEHGAVMLASILKTKRAAEVSVFVVRAFVRLRRTLGDQRRIVLKLAELERTIAVHDDRLKVLFDASRKLMQKPKPEPEPERRKIGFQVREPFSAPYRAWEPRARGKKRGRSE